VPELKRRTQDANISSAFVCEDDRSLPPATTFRQNEQLGTMSLSLSTLKTSICFAPCVCR
jgi:hypothetical protein